MSSVHRESLAIIYACDLLTPRRSLSETSQQIHLPRKQRLINRERHRHTTDEGMDSYR